MESGYVHSPPQPTLRTTKTEVCSFTKDDNTACGAVGVMTYELFNMYTCKCTGTIAVMFSVPFDQNLYKNWIAVGVFEEESKCNKELYKLMYEGKDFTQFMRAKGDGNGLMHSDKGVEIRACMSSEGRAIVKLEVYDQSRPL